VIRPHQWIILRPRATLLLNPCHKVPSPAFAHLVCLKLRIKISPDVDDLNGRRRTQLSQTNATIVRRFTEEVITKGKIDAAAQFVWEDVVEQVPRPGQRPGLEGLKDILRYMRSGFPDIDFSVKEQISEGDKVASRFEWTGTHQGEFMGVPATGKPVRVWGIVIDRLEDGRIKDTRIIMDTLGLMMQLGAVAPPGA
jgi:steroid delta-isomerase-like uncharacterized protein